MVTPIAPPQPPQNMLDTSKRLAVFKEMQSQLEATLEYQEKSITYHQQMLEQFKEESASTKTQLELCRNTIKTLTSTSELIPSPEVSGQSNGHGTVETATEIHNETKTEVKTLPLAESTDSERTHKPINPDTSKPRKTGKTKTSKVKSKAPIESRPKSNSKLPDSPKLNKFESITAAVLDFVRGQESVVSAGDIVQHFYPDGLVEKERKKAYTSFSNVLSAGVKKGIYEKTVPGKYRYKE